MSQANGMRVLMVTPRYLPWIGGVESHVYEVARRLARDGTDITVLTTDTTGKLPTRETMDGVEVERVRAYPAERDYYLAPGLVQAMRGREWDVLHLQSYHTLVAPLAMQTALLMRRPYVVTFHGGGHTSSVRNAGRGLQRRLLKPLLARAARLVAIARFELELYGTQLGLPAEKFVLIPNGADLPAPTDLRAPQAESGSSTAPLIASVGRLEQYKGHQRVIAALPHLLHVVPDARLWIAGTGPYEGELRQQAQALGVADRVEIRAIPAANRDEMARRVQQASLVVLLSEYETHPIAVLEALSLGRPALVAETSGLSELVERGWARGVPLSSPPENVAQAMLEQLRAPLVPPALHLPTWDECAAKLSRVYAVVRRRQQCAF